MSEAEISQLADEFISFLRKEKLYGHPLLEKFKHYMVKMTYRIIYRYIFDS